MASWKWYKETLLSQPSSSAHLFANVLHLQTADEAMLCSNALPSPSPQWRTGSHQQRPRWCPWLTSCLSAPLSLSASGSSPLPTVPFLLFFHTGHLARWNSFLYGFPSFSFPLPFTHRLGKERVLFTLSEIIILAENYWLLSRAIISRGTPIKQTLLPGTHRYLGWDLISPKPLLYPISPVLENAGAI